MAYKIAVLTTQVKMLIVLAPYILCFKDFLIKLTIFSRKFIPRITQVQLQGHKC
jgi:hypothetical protein